MPSERTESIEPEPTDGDEQRNGDGDAGQHLRGEDEEGMSIGPAAREAAPAHKRRARRGPERHSGREQRDTIRELSMPRPSAAAALR